MVKDFVETYLYFIKRGEKQSIVLIRKHLKLIADLFYARKDPTTGREIQAAIVWANRGGGKSLIDSIVIFLCMIWRNKSFSDLAGSQEQAMEVYEYVTGFWHCLPILKERLLDGEPLMTRTKLKNGVSLKCIANSQNQARGKHPEGFIADEACQKERYKDENVMQATNSVLTQDEFLIIYSSTFHLPTGIFAATWENAEALEFKRYRWNIYDCMRLCRLKIDCHECKLTRKVLKRDAEGNIIKTKYFGCNGRAKKAKGWLTFNQVFKIKTKAMIRGHNWKVEFECCRPETAGRVYRTKAVRKSLVDRIIVPKIAERVVGLDWGVSKQCAIVLGILSPNGLLIPWSDFSTGTDLDYIVQALQNIRTRFGNFVVYADAEQAYGGMYLQKSGFQVEKIAFNKYKEVGIQNLGRYFDSHRLKILNTRPNRILWRQLINYKKDETGKPIKKEDHGCDSLMCAGLRFDFMHFFGKALRKEAAEDVLKEMSIDDGAESKVDIF